jgi:2,4-dichlorophenol 6-monooxygenase
VFCVGDAIHRHPPTNGLGSNTSVQDSYNLCWKLAHVIRGSADASLLDSYQAERAPVARQIVERANQSIADTARIMQALDLTDTSDVDKLEERLAVRKAPGPDGDKTRRAVREAIAYKSYEFNAHGVEHNHRYASSAVVPDGTPAPEFVRDAELYAQPTSWPGAKLPHAWVTRRGGVRVSTLDLGGRGEFSVYTGIGGQAWLDAAAKVSGLQVRGVSIGPGEEFEDPYGYWADVNEIDDAGVLLVRPDLYVAFRHIGAPASPEQASELLNAALASVLGK